MSEAEKQASAKTTEVELEGSSLLEQAISATKQTERSRAEELLKTLTEEALKGTVTFSKNLTRTLTQAITAIGQRNDAIAAATEEQTATTAAVDRNLTLIRDAANQTAAGAQQTSASSQQLSALAADLHGALQRLVV